MNLNSLDLNLLVALDALLREANVSRAAMRIGLSQPAASHALQRLRDLIGDPLLVRTGARMELTPRAQGAARPAGAGARAGARPVHARRFRCHAQRAALPPDDARSRRRTADAAADGEGHKARAQRHHRRGAVARLGHLRPPEFARTIDLVCSIGDGFKGFHRQLLYTDSDALAVRRGHPAGARLKKRDAFLAGAACRRRDPRPERGSDRHLAAQQEHRAAHRAGRARLYRGAACRGAHRPRRLRAAPADHGACKAIVAADDRSAVRSRDRRAISVLSDPRPDGPGLDLAAQPDARHRARDGARQASATGRLGKRR